MMEIWVAGLLAQKSFVLGISGHAGAAPAGEDTVCAAASMLAYTVAQEVLEMHRKGKLREEPKIKLAKGEALIACKPKRAARREVYHLYKTAQTGYKLLAANFPDNVRLYPSEMPEGI